MILATTSCIAVACYPQFDGETEIILGPADEVDPGYPPSFTGTLKTPDHSVVVSTIEEKTILEMPVAGTMTGTRIWLSDPRWPDKVIVGVD
jgi:hypothetical protein